MTDKVTLLKEIKTLEKQLDIYLSCIDTTKKEDLIIIRDYLIPYIVPKEPIYEKKEIDNIVILDEKRPHRHSSVICDNCKKKWEAVHKVESTVEEELKKLECPYCETRGNIRLVLK